MGNMRNIVVVPYDPAWPERYRQEAAALASILGPELVAIHHIGSTAVPGLSAKPVIDILPVVRDVGTLDPFHPALIALGYEPRGENGIPGRRFFSKGTDGHRTHHVHAFGVGHAEIARHLDMRDYLIAHPEEALQYASLKIELAKQYPHDILGYMAGKDAFIKEVLMKAGEWRAA